LEIPGEGFASCLIPKPQSLRYTEAIAGHDRRSEPQRAQPATQHPFRWILGLFVIVWFNEIGRRRLLPGRCHQSAYFVPSRAMASDPLFTSNTPELAAGLLGSGSAGTACHELEDFVKGSSGSLRR